MKKSIILLVAAMAAISCAKETNQKQQVTDNTPEVKGVTINVLAGDSNTKTVVLDGEIPSVQWDTEDKVKVFEVMDGVIKGNADSQNASIVEGKASFKTTLDWAAAEGASYQYSAVYPATSVKYESSHYYIVLPWKQQLVGGNLSADSDILFSNVLDHGASRVTEDESVAFAFRRLGTLVRLTLVGINSGETIHQVTINAPVSIAGSIQFDPVTGTVDSGTAFDKDASSEVTLVLGDVEATGTDVVWFRVMSERDWGQAGDEVSFEVITDKNVYRKTVSSPTIKFADGGLTKFGVNLGSSIVAPLSVPYSNDFADNVNGWFFIDADEDGYNWGLGSGLLESASEYFGPLTPDNWAFTPGIRLTENSYLSFWTSVEKTEYLHEHYAVYISQVPPVKANLTNSTVLMPEAVFPDGSFTELSDDGLSQHYVINIPAQYANKVVYIGFRHFNCTNLSRIQLKDVEVVEGMPAIGSLATYDKYLGTWGNLTIEQKVADESYTVSGFVDQGEYSVEARFANGQLVLYDQVVHSSGNTQVALQGTDNELHTKGFPEENTRVLFKAVYNQNHNLLRIVPGNSYTQYIWLTYDNETYKDHGSYTAIPDVLTIPVTYIYREDFEDGMEGWSLFDDDGDGYQWYRSTEAAYQGDYSLFSESFHISEALNADNWAFTPAITLTTNNSLSFWVRAYWEYPNEHYGVYITTTTPSYLNLDKCTLLLEQTYPDGTPVETSDDEYQRYVIPIPSEYNGQSVYIGFRHNCYDQFWLSIDDVCIIEGANH